MSPWRMVAAFTLGLACAIWLLPVMAGPSMQRITLERDEYRKRAEALEAQVAKLKEAQAKAQDRSEPVVQKVKVHLEGADHRVVVEAERRLEKQLSQQYMGRPLNDVEPFLLTRRVQGSLLEIDGVRYQLDVDLLTVWPDLALYGVLEPLKGS